VLSGGHASAWRAALQTTDGPVALVLSLPSWELFEAQPRDYRFRTLFLPVISALDILGLKADFRKDPHHPAV